MISSRTLLTTAGALLLVGLVVWFVLERTEAEGRGMGASIGALAPFDASLVEEWEVAARLSPSELRGGPIRDIDARGDTLFLIQRNYWVHVPKEGPVRAFGSEVRGDPSWIGGGIGIAALAEGVAVLDRGRSEISYWSRDGERIAARPFGDARATAVEPHGLVSDGDAAHFLSVRVLQPSGDGEWLVVRFQGMDGPGDTVYRADTHLEPWGALNAPAVAVREDGAFEIGPGNEWAFLSYGPDGRLLTDWKRADGPRWVVPDSARRAYAAILDQIPPQLRRGLALPEHLPPVAAFGLLEGGGRAVLVTAGWDDRFHLEVLAGDGAPIGRLWEDPTTDPIFFAQGRVIRIRELPGSTEVDWAVPRVRR